jgi:hypothetical protein
MVKLSKSKLEEIVKIAATIADQEIAKAREANADLKDDDVEAIKSKYTFMALQEMKRVSDMGPKKLFQYGFAEDVNGWRTGYTKPSLASRVKERRARNKSARKARRINRIVAAQR